jgi:hypothetical protein
VNSPTQKNLDTCLLSLKDIEQNKGSNSSSRIACEEKNSGIHLDAQLN